MCVCVCVCVCGGGGSEKSMGKKSHSTDSNPNVKSGTQETRGA